MTSSYVFITVLGIILGSFANVLILRYNTGRTLSGRSHCFACKKTLKAKNLIPIASYLFQGGRCGHCSARFSPQYLLVELLMGALFLLSALTFWGSPLLYVVLPIVFLSVCITVYDSRHFIIPDAWVIAMTVLGLIWVAIQHSLGGFDLPGTLLAMVIPLAFALLWFATKGKSIGFGDIKLLIPLGIILGFSGLLTGVIVAFWIGLVVAAGIFVAKRYIFKEPDTTTDSFLKTQIPFGPFLLIGMLLVLFTGFDWLSWVVG